MRRLFLFLLLACSSLAAQITVVFLRHAEKTSRRTNAELTQVGRRRAQQLAGELAVFQPNVLFASNHRRTQRTLEPLAERLGLPLQVYLRGAERDLGQRLLQECAGKTVVVCGHSDTLMDLAAALGYRPSFPEVSGFDRFWVLRVAAPGGQVTLDERRQAQLPR
jgi:phosphohistidine phosphatase SixA